MRNRLPHTSQHCWIITNKAHPKGHPCVVLGAGDARHPWDLVHVDRCARDHIPLVKRYTGGGTVFVDHNSLLCSMIGPFEMLRSCANTMDSDTFHQPPLKPYPKDMLLWTSLFWKRLFERYFGIRDFALQENDFAFGEKKFGGNAQYITGGRTNRWVQHTSFLWDYEREHMDQYLKLPTKIPEYRKKRAHGDFLCKLSDRLQAQSSRRERRRLEESQMEVLPSVISKDTFIDSIEHNVEELARGKWKDAIADVREVTLQEVESFMLPNQVFGTYELNMEELMKDKHEITDTAATAAAAAIAAVSENL